MTEAPGAEAAPALEGSEDPEHQPDRTGWSPPSQTCEEPWGLPQALADNVSPQITAGVCGGETLKQPLSSLGAGMGLYPRLGRCRAGSFPCAGAVPMLNRAAGAGGGSWLGIVTPNWW